MPAFAEVTRGNLRLLLAGGRTPQPGGWNRIHPIVADIAAEVTRLRGQGCASATTSSPARAASRS